MAKSETRKKGGCLKAIVIFVIIIGVLVAAFFVLINFTPNQLGLGGAQINGKTLNELGIADTKIKDIWSVVKSFASAPKEEEVVTNGYDEEDKTDADDTTTGSYVVPAKEDGTPDYVALLTGAAVRTDLLPVVYTDSQLAYMLDTALQQFYASDTSDIAAEISGAVQMLKDLDASVREITLYRQDGDLYARFVLKLDISKYVSDIHIPLVTLSDTLYLTVTDKITVGGLDTPTTRGEVVYGSGEVAVNGRDTTTSQVILDALFKAMDEDYTSEDICEKVAEVFSYVCGNLGKIGSMNGLLPVYGESGIDTDKTDAEITFLAA